MAHAHVRGFQSITECSHRCMAHTSSFQSCLGSLYELWHSLRMYLTAELYMRWVASCTVRDSPTERFPVFCTDKASARMVANLYGYISERMVPTRLAGSEHSYLRALTLSPFDAVTSILVHIELDKVINIYYNTKCAVFFLCKCTVHHNTVWTLRIEPTCMYCIKKITCRVQNKETQTLTPLVNGLVHS